MTTGELVKLLIGRLDSIEQGNAEFRDEMRADIVEVKQLTRLTNGRVTALERHNIGEQAKLAERARIEAELAQLKDQRMRPVQQMSVGLVTGVGLTLIAAALNSFNIV